MELESIQDLIGYIQQTQEASSQEETLAEKLERQKRLLLKKQELEDWRKIAEATKSFCEQEKRNNRHLMKQANTTKSLCRQIDQLKIEVQKVIDRSIEQTLNSAQEQSRRFHLKEERREKKRLQINQLKQQLERHEEIVKHIRESKGQAMLREAKAIAEEEAKKLDIIRLEREKLCRAQCEKELIEWEESKLAIVEIGNLWKQVRMQEQDNEAIEKINGSLKAEIDQITEELEQQRIFEEEEAKRQEEESSQRALTPIKISVPDMAMFKDPNDFPSITTKIEASRRSYENIFKRPEYMELRKLKNDKRLKQRKQSQLALQRLIRDADKSQLAVVISNLKIGEQSNTAQSAVVHPDDAAVITATVSDPQPKRVVEEQPLRVSVSNFDEPITHVKQKTPARKDVKQPKVSRHDPAPVGRRHKLKPEKLNFKETPVQSNGTCVVEKPLSARKRSQPSELPVESADTMVSAVKRSKKHLSQHNAKEIPVIQQPEAKKVEQKPTQTVPEPEPFSPPPPPPSVPQVDQDLSAQPVSPAGVEAGDSTSNSGSSPSPPKNSRRGNQELAFDDVSLGGGSISSFDITDRDSSSDLGFNLSPVGSFGEDGGSKRGGSSPGRGSDYDFLDTSSPKPRASGSQQKAAKSDGFDFMGGGDNNDDFDLF